MEQTKSHFNHSLSEEEKSSSCFLQTFSSDIQSYIKLINAYLKKNNIEICSDNTYSYIKKYTRQEFENKLREFYDLPKNITPQNILKAKVKNHELSEHEEQCLIVKWCRENNIKVFAIPNGFISGGDYKYINYMKAEGLTPGVPDLIVLIGNGIVLFLEVKKEKNGKLSKEQEKFKKFCEDNNYNYYCCKGAEDGINFIKKYLQK